MGLVHGRPTDTDTAPFYVLTDRRATHRRITRASNERTNLCPRRAQVSMAQVPARLEKSAPISRLFAVRRARVRARRGTRGRTGEGTGVSFFIGAGSTLEKIHLDYVAIACARGEGKSFFLGTYE